MELTVGGVSVYQEAGHGRGRVHAGRVVPGLLLEEHLTTEKK